MESQSSTCLQLPERTASLPRQPAFAENHTVSDDSCQPQVFRLALQDENHRGYTQRWSLPTVKDEDRVRTPPIQPVPTTFFRSQSTKADKRHTLSDHPPPSADLRPEALDRDELLLLVRTLHIDAHKARRDVFRLQATLDSVMSQAARERERLCETIEYQRQVIEASNRESRVLKVQLEEALETLGTMLLQER